MHGRVVGPRALQREQGGVLGGACGRVAGQGEDGSGCRVRGELQEAVWGAPEALWEGGRDRELVRCQPWGVCCEQQQQEAVAAVGGWVLRHARLPPQRRVPATRGLATSRQVRQRRARTGYDGRRVLLWCRPCTPAVCFQRVGQAVATQGTSRGARSQLGWQGTYPRLVRHR